MALYWIVSVHDCHLCYCIGISGFFPFGVANGDVVAPRVFDGSFGPTLLDVPLVLFNIAETNIFVSSYIVHEDDT